MSATVGLSDEGRTTIMDFLKGKLTDDEMQQAEAMLDEIATGNPTLAVDARMNRAALDALPVHIRRQAVQAVAEMRAAAARKESAGARKYAERFPNSGRLGR